VTREDGPEQHIADESSGLVADRGGEAVDARQSQGLVYKPSGSVTQHFGDEVHGNKIVHIHQGIPEPAPETLPQQPFEPETILVPEGAFLMGSVSGPEVPEHETPQHEVNLPDYRIGKYPVTNEQYLAFVHQAGVAVAPEVGWTLAPVGQVPRPGKDNHPVVGVSWDEAVGYCRWLSERTGRSYRLPTEAEWEKAARGTEGQIYPWGNEWDASRCNGRERNIGGTAPVSKYSQGASPYGVLHMAGNVWEWTSTQWGRDRAVTDFSYPYQANDGREVREALAGPFREMRIGRGGSFRDPPERLTCSTRARFPANSRRPTCGFRVAMEVTLQ
jgi:formylglycine-generating enzyme required for sulfatase activity